MGQGFEAVILFDGVDEQEGRGGTVCGRIPPEGLDARLVVGKTLKVADTAPAGAGYDCTGCRNVDENLGGHSRNNSRS